MNVDRVIKLGKSTLGISLLFLQACGGSGHKEKKASVKQELTLENFAVGFIEGKKSELDFGLVDEFTSEFTIDIKDCASGRQMSVVSTASNPVTSVPLYLNDTNCTAGLVNFTKGGLLYTKVNGGALTSGTAVFSEPGGNQFNVTAGAPLPSPLTSGSSIQFVSSQTVFGTDQSVTGAFTAADLSISGIEAPNLKVQNMTLTKIAAGSGNPTFEVSVECNLPTQAAGTLCPTSSGDPQPLIGMKAKLVPDTFGGVLTSDTAATIMSQGGTSIAASHLAGAVIGVNDGFKVSLTQSAGNLEQNKSMLLIVATKPASSNTISYRYFKVSIGSF